MTKEKFENLDCVMLVHNGIRGFSQLHRGKWLFSEHQMVGDTHHALLLNLEEINPCVHETNKIRQMNWTSPQNGFNPGLRVLEDIIYKCECGIEVEPTGFKEKK